MGKVILSGKGRRWVQSGHPWIYADDIHGGSGESGELLPVEDPNGNHLGWGLHSSSSRIAVRLVTRSKAQPDRAFWLARMKRAIAVRDYLVGKGAVAKNLEVVGEGGQYPVATNDTREGRMINRRVEIVFVDE